MTENTQETTVVEAPPVVESPPVKQAPPKATHDLKDMAIKAIRRSDHFPTTQDIAVAVIEAGFPLPPKKGKAMICNKLVRMIEAGELDEALRESGSKHRAAPERAGPTDELGRKGHRRLALGMILREGRGFRVCGKTTKDLTEENKKRIVELRKRGKSWREITDEVGLEHNNGMTARNVFLAMQRSKGR